jgi:hypothetical protein
MCEVVAVYLLFLSDIKEKRSNLEEKGKGPFPVDIPPGSLYAPIGDHVS